VNQFQPIVDKQKDYFNTDATKSYEWRIEQLDNGIGGSERIGAGTRTASSHTGQSCQPGNH
jgi:hypothetical protein